MEYASVDTRRRKGFRGSCTTSGACWLGCGSVRMHTDGAFRGTRAAMRQMAWRMSAGKRGKEGNVVGADMVDRFDMAYLA